jgi:hypothetical protein
MGIEQITDARTPPRSTMNAATIVATPHSLPAIGPLPLPHGAPILEW